MTTQETKSEVVTAKEVAARTGLSVGAVYNAAKADALPFPAYRVGKRFIFPRAPFENFLRGEVPSGRAA